MSATSKLFIIHFCYHSLNIPEFNNFLPQYILSLQHSAETKRMWKLLVGMWFSFSFPRQKEWENGAEFYRKCKTASVGCCVETLFTSFKENLKWTSIHKVRKNKWPCLLRAALPVPSLTSCKSALPTLLVCMSTSNILLSSRTTLRCMSQVSALLFLLLFVFMGKGTHLHMHTCLYMLLWLMIA